MQISVGDVVNMGGHECLVTRMVEKDIALFSDPKRGTFVVTSSYAELKTKEGDIMFKIFYEQDTEFVLSQKAQASAVKPPDVMPWRK